MRSPPVHRGFSARAAPLRPVKHAVKLCAQAPASSGTYTVNLPKPIGVRFARGNDGAAYVLASDERIGNTDERIQAGDKVLRVSASFGADVWDATGFGQVMYAIKTRNGDVYLELMSRGGDMSIFDRESETAAERNFREERAGGNYGAGTKEIQARNYIAMKESERRRKELFSDALELFREGKVKEALVGFEEVKGMEPEGYISDSFARVSRIYIVTQYNIACCYSMLEAADAGLEALEDCLKCGFEEFDKVRGDKNLAYLRKDERFKPMLDKYDEPILNENAIRALKSIFSFGKKD